MTRAHSKVHADKEPKLISSFLRLAVKNPRKADKARQDLYNSIAKSDRILEALLKKINTNKAECPVEKKAIIKIVEASQRNLHKALYRVSVTIQQRLREIEIPVPDCSGAIQEALRNMNLESSNMMLAIDYTIANLTNGEQSFEEKCLHALNPSVEMLNPYQEVLTRRGRVLVEPLYTRLLFLSPLL
ncbi:uncharacterized protein IUM83_04409 [Phytophthora cinnamomi]|uniref:uncharacterized protein n=1 Tax=Phytophthora cinnamomi TaxID=4785 RepID=UPI00355A7F7A|nr:hypothetical protein IUM83_04409 [Phytophthora cinnamomi]